MTAVLFLADAQALAARATAYMEEHAWFQRATYDRDRAAIASALRRMERHQPEQGSVALWCLACLRWLSEPCPDYLDATADLLRHCAPYTEAPS